MRIALGSDHAGYPLKAHLIDHLRSLGHEPLDCGAFGPETSDYPIFCAEAARRVRDGEADRAIVIGGSGQGEAISANKVTGVRAALCPDTWTAELARRHNDANVLSLGARIVAAELAEEILRVFLETPFEGGRHVHRLAQIAEIEARERGSSGSGEPGAV